MEKRACKGNTSPITQPPNSSRIPCSSCNLSPVSAAPSNPPVIIAAKLPQDPPRSWGLNFHVPPSEAALTPWSSEPLCTQLEGRAVPGIRFLIQAWHFTVPRCPKQLSSPCSTKDRAAGGRGGQTNTHATGLASPGSRNSLRGGFYKDLCTLQGCVGERQGCRTHPQTHITLRISWKFPSSQCRTPLNPIASGQILAPDLTP